MKLEVKGLEFGYDSVPVLENVDLKVESGEILGVIGPNASGKTTLLKCIDGILNPQVGTVLIDGSEASKLSNEEMAKRFGYVPQADRESFPTTVFNTVLMGRKPHGSWKPSDSDLEVVSRIIEEFGLDDIAMRDIGEISGGQRQKVLIARALAQEPEVLLLDEPTSSLDLRHQLEVLNIVKEETGGGISTAMAMHDLNLASRYCDKIVMLNGGKIFAAGGGKILTPENIESVYGVKVSIEEKSKWRMVIPEEPTKD